MGSKFYLIQTPVFCTTWAAIGKNLHFYITDCCEIYKNCFKSWRVSSFLNRNVLTVAVSDLVSRSEIVYSFKLLEKFQHEHLCAAVYK